MIIETLGPFDPFFASTGKHSKRFFNHKWELKNLKVLNLKFYLIISGTSEFKSY